MDIVFTEERLKALAAPETGETVYRDVKTPGLSVRVRAGGGKTYVVRYRLKGGRGSPERRMRLGEVGAVALDAARRNAQRARLAIEDGRDPAAERRAVRVATAKAASEAKPTLATLIDAHEKDQAARGVVSAAAAAKSLRKELADLLDRDPATLTRSELVSALDRIRDGDGRNSPRPGLVPTLRARVHGLLAWAENSGRLGSDKRNPMAGYRAARRGKAARVAEAARGGGIMLDMAEIAALWRACDDADRVRPSFGAYIKLLILTGCRRGEMAQARSTWIKPATADRPPVLVIPPVETRSGREHTVPLASLAQNVIAGVKRFADTDLLTPGARSRRTGKTAPISGWSKSWPALLKVAGDHGLNRKPALHDLRKSFRSHLARLGVADRVAEAMLNHAPTDRLIGIYDKHDYLAERIEAAEKWAAEVSQALAEPPRRAGDAVMLRPPPKAAKGRPRAEGAA
jgi:integrase